MNTDAISDPMLGKKTKKNKAFGILELAVIIITSAFVVCVMLCFMKRQREDANDIIWEIDGLNGKFAEEGVNLILRVKFRLK